jgi:hypothetical protein
MTATPKVLPETPVRPPGAPGVADVLSDVLRVIHLSGAIFFHADVSAPWGRADRISGGAGHRLAGGFAIEKWGRIPGAKKMSSFSKLTEHRGSIPGASYKWAGHLLNSGDQVMGTVGIPYSRIL